MIEILGSGKCKCLNLDEKDKLSISIFRAIQIFSERMKEEMDHEMKESYKGHIEDFQKLKEKIKNTPEC
jgi:predicted RNA-binding protein with RPS1 domain